MSSISRRIAVITCSRPTGTAGVPGSVTSTASAASRASSSPRSSSARRASTAASSSGNSTLVNPKRLLVTSFAVTNPLGFGILQRDRSFAHYEDLEARYEKRPSLWVEPIGDWRDGLRAHLAGR